jgi:SAM-dependent methyltransferase
MSVASSQKTASVDGRLDPFHHRGEYGVDGDFTHLPARVHAIGVATFGLAMTSVALRNIALGRRRRGAAAAAIGGLVTGSGALYGYATRVGKFDAWAEQLTGLGLRGDERLLDLGCGRGAVLLTAAKLLPRGRAVGIDLWRPNQTGNLMGATLRNARLEGVTDRVDVETGNVTRLPFPDASFDVVVSSLVIHNIHRREGRRAAIHEAARVLRPGGRLVIADLLFSHQYVEWLRQLGLGKVQRRNLGPRLWFGGPWFSVNVVTAVR